MAYSDVPAECETIGACFAPACGQGVPPREGLGRTRKPNHLQHPGFQGLGGSRSAVWGGVGGVGICAAEGSVFTALGLPFGG